MPVQLRDWCASDRSCAGGIAWPLPLVSELPIHPLFRLDRQFAAPVEDKQSAEQHAAEVGKVGDATGQSGNAEKQLNAAEEDHKVACFHRDGREQQHDAAVGEEHAKGEEDAVGAAGGAQCWIDCAGGMKGGGADDELDQAGANHAGEVIKQEALRAPAQFDLTAKHPEREHVEKDMHEIAVEEAIGEDLPWVEAKVVAFADHAVANADRPEREVLFKHPDAAWAAEQRLQQEQHAVGDEQIKDDRRDCRLFFR